MRRILAEDPEWNVPSVPSLVDTCLQSIVKHFRDHPILEKLPERFKQSAIDKLSVDLPLSLTVNMLADDGYWKRCFVQKFGLDAAPSLKRPWKRMFVEKTVQQALEEYVPSQSSLEGLLALLSLCGALVEELELRQLLPPPDHAAPPSEDPADEAEDFPDEQHSHLDHVNFELILPKLPNLKSFNVVYVVRDCGMNFSWSLLGMTRGDAFALGAALRDAKSLESLTVHSSLLDDTKTRILISRLLSNNTLTSLDLSHNAIGDKGARAIAKFLSGNKSLTSLNLCDNQIHAAGARAIAISCRDHPALSTLNLRLNRLEDQGGKYLFDSLLGNRTLTALNIASNSIGKGCIASLCNFLQRHTHLRHLEMSCNEMGAEAGKMLLSALEANRTLRSTDMRLCKFSPETELEINKILQRNLKVAAPK